MVWPAVGATPTDARTRVVTTPDGRELGVCEWGDPDGGPLLWMHGSPGSRLLRHPGRAYADRHLRVITYDRPGYGVSTPVRGQRVADAAADVDAIADALDLPHLAVGGVSGGGPRALAAAALLPDQVTRCVTVVSHAPFTAPDLDFYDGMDDESRSEWQAAVDGPDAMDAHCAKALAWVRAGLPELDMPHAEEMMLRDAFTEAFRQGVEGYREDRMSLTRDWGFEVSDVAAPTRMMVAVDDSSVPRTHWDWLCEHLPNATLEPVPGDHFGPRDEPEMQLLAWAGAPEHG